MKTCFVICPIGAEGSETRKLSDDVFDLIIQPALEKYDFRVIRGDKLATASTITEDIVNYIKNAELCIIDLSGRNPNVFYECGRRHECGLPFIHIKRKGEDVPFDLAGIRTFDYDLTNGRTIRESVLTLRRFVDELEISGYGSQSPETTLNSIARTLTIIEKRLNDLDIKTSFSASPAKAEDSGMISGNPANAFYNALDKGDFTKATLALNKFMKINKDINLHLDMASALVEVYEPRGVPIVRELLDRYFDELQAAKIAIALYGLYTYYTGALTIKDEYTYLKNLTNKALQKAGLSNKETAALYNVLASLEYSIKNDEESLEYQKKTIEFAPEEPAYYYNIATIYKVLNKQQELIDSLDKLVDIYHNRDLKKEQINITYLQYAKDIFLKAGMENKATAIDNLIAQTGS